MKFFEISNFSDSISDSVFCIKKSKGEIKVSYDTNKTGRFNKQIIIFSNAKQKRKIVRIKGFVNNGISLEKKKSILSNI